MTSGIARVMSDEEMKRRASKRKTQQGGTGSSETQCHTVEDSMKPPKPKAQKSTVQVVDVDNVNITLPADFLTAEGVDNGVWPEADRLLFPAAHHRLQTLDAESIANQGAEYLLQGIQNNLATRAYVQRVAAKDRDRSREIEKQKKEIQELRHKLSTADERQKKALNEQKDKFDKEYKAKVEDFEKAVAKERENEIAAKNEEITRLERNVTDLSKDVMDTIADSTIRGKAKMAYLVYFEGATKDDCRKVIDEYLEDIWDMDDLKPPKKDDNKVTDSTADSGKPKDSGATPDAEEVIEENK